MKRTLTTLLALTLMMVGLAGPGAKLAAARRIFSVQPTNEDGGPPTDQFTTADPVFAVFRADVEGGEICVVDADGGGESHCKTIAAYIGTGWTLIAPGLPPGTYRLRASDTDPDYSFLSLPFTVVPCDQSDETCSARRRLSDEVVAGWKAAAGRSFTGFGQMCSTMEVAGSFKKPKVGRGFLFAKKAADDVNEQRKDWGWEAGIVVVGVGYGLGLAVAEGGIATQAYKPYLALIKELSCGAQQMYSDIMNDPPDQSYTTVAPPVFTALPPTGDATNDRLALTLDRKRAFGRAQLKAYERYLGAAAAGDETSVRLQAQAIADYGRTLTAEMKESAASLRAWGAAQAADADIDNPAVTQPDLDTADALFERVRAGGFTQDEINQLAAAGLSQDEIEEIRADYNHSLAQARVGVSLQTIAEEAATSLETAIPAFNTFSREAGWVAGGLAPKTISLTPAVAALQVGTTQTLSAGVTGASGAPVAGVSVTLKVTGANSATLTATTDAGGAASFSYAGNNAGDDSLVASAGTASSNVAAVHWSSDPPNALPSVNAPDPFTDEGANGGFFFNFADADAQDTHTAKVDWGDGSPATTLPSDGSQGILGESNGSGFILVFHTYVESGVYNAKVTVTDNHGGVGSATPVMHVQNRPPRLDNVAADGVNGKIFVSAAFADQGTKDTHTASLDWGDGTTSAAEMSEANGVGTVAGNHAYGAPGAYTVTLTVSDDDGGADARAIGITVGDNGLSNSPPVLEFNGYSTYEGGGSSIGIPFTDHDTLDAHTATINWGDGSPTEATFVQEFGGRGQVVASHAYLDNGTFNVTITLADNRGGVDVKSGPMLARDAPPRVSPVRKSSKLISLGEAVTVSADFTDFGIKDTHTAVWDWGDGTTTAGDVTEANGSGTATGSHVYNTVGVYNITLTVTDNDGESGVWFDDPVGVYAATIQAGAIQPVVTETGRISLSISGRGTAGQGGVLQVEKPAGATVRRAFFAAATTGFRQYLLRPGDVTLKGVEPSWGVVAPNSIFAYNYWADVTSIVKAKLDAAPAGRNDILFTELPTNDIDGVVLAVIFDDPGQPKENTVALLFGAQRTRGDTFALRFARPIDKDDPNFALVMSLGISFGYQGSNQQYSLIDVNGRRMTTSAGGEDDGEQANGALLTVGGLGDGTDNPSDPMATPTNGARSDDELYDLRPFVNTGDSTMTVNTLNPSDDDNIFFAAFFLQATAAVVGEGVVLTPASASNHVGAQHTVTATAQDAEGRLIAGRQLTFEVLSGPHAGLTGASATDGDGLARFTYTGTAAGTDTIVAKFEDGAGRPQTSNTVTAGWEAATVAPTTTVTDGKMFANGGAGVLSASLLDINSQPVANRTMTLALGAGLGAQTCSAKTDASGKASCRIDKVMQPLGPGEVSGRFDGDSDYLGSAGRAPALIFEYPVGAAGGAFVIGDLNATVGRQVTFWGAQWARSNALSGGAAPSSFKGFADRTSTDPTACGGSWATGPGNSAGPPRSVPAYMAVIVSSAITKSGSAIAGNAPRVVIVKTDAGYSSDPGHAGTGKVVAVWCQ
jgi:PKD repeat protein